MKEKSGWEEVTTKEGASLSYSPQGPLTVSRPKRKSVGTELRFKDGTVVTIRTEGEFIYFDCDPMTALASIREIYADSGS